MARRLVFVCILLMVLGVSLTSAQDDDSTLMVKLSALISLSDNLWVIDLESETVLFEQDNRVVEASAFVMFTLDGTRLITAGNEPAVQIWGIGE